MIPRIIHYCWFGRSEMPDLARQCVESWHRYMPDWEYKLWSEDNFDVTCIPYVQEAYNAGKYAFVSDYVRLWALAEEGGVYLDTDVKVLKSFDSLMAGTAFMGFEGSKHLPVGTCVMASVPNEKWLTDLLELYGSRRFVGEDGHLDLTTNVFFITDYLTSHGLSLNGQEQYVGDLHIYPVEFFSPRRTTGEYICTEHTFSDHLGLNSWSVNSGSWKLLVRNLVGQKVMTRLIKLKRKIIG